jgi:hypothetical protein
MIVLYVRFSDDISRYYWDFAPGYSYVDVATAYNHATFVIPIQTHFRLDNCTVLTAQCENGLFKLIN